MPQATAPQATPGRPPQAWQPRAWEALALALLALDLWSLLGMRGAWTVVGMPLLEELVFRAGLHEALLRARAAGRLRLLALHPQAANVVVALLFAGAHLHAHPPLWAAATLLPALAIGALYQATRRTTACALLHAAFNLCWLLLARTAAF